MGGRCDGGAFVDAFFTKEIFGECRDCHFLEQRTTHEDEHVTECQVLEGRDELTYCPGLQEHIRYHDIKLYGVNKK